MGVSIPTAEGDTTADAAHSALEVVFTSAGGNSAVYRLDQGFGRGPIVDEDAS
ncbi:hypothetical protein [Streptomyces sp. CA-179760]|uniref:hypothetical protein n=1 Tax=Streptomyces sp. CA-179760 TaxID=3240054 RepID=UPI003D8C8876